MGCGFDFEQLDDAILVRKIELNFAPELLRALWDRIELPFPEPAVE